MTMFQTVTRYCLLFVLLTTYGCVHRIPEGGAVPDYLSRAETQRDGQIEVSAAVLTDKESDQVFDSPLTSADIQLIWIDIENPTDQKYLVMLPAVDPDYFSPSEAAWRSRRFLERPTSQTLELFTERHIPFWISENSRVSGFVYSNHDPGIKAFTVQLIGDEVEYAFDFAQFVPGINVDFAKTDPGGRYDSSTLPELAWMNCGNISMDFRVAYWAVTGRRRETL